MIILSATTHSLEVVVSGSGISVDYTTSSVDITTSAFTPLSSQGNITSGATTTLVAAPAASTQRQIKSLFMRNKGTTTAVATFSKDVAGADYQVFVASLLPGDSIHYQDGAGWTVVDASGRTRIASTQDTGRDGQAGSLFKIGTAPEAAGQWYSWAKDSGNPGAWAPGTPGINGRATDGTTAADNGCVRIKNAATGNNYLTNFTGATSVACNPWLFDVLWINTALVVTTTTAQAITPVALPARDSDGATSGEGVWAGILVTTATTNAGAVTTITLSYTNQDGTAGKVATMASYPATAVIGTVVWFQLAAGDRGVRSVQSITLGTTLTAGAISLILARPLWNFPSLVVNVGGVNVPQNPGVRLYSGTCALPIGLMSTTTATTLSATVTVMER